MSALPQSVNYQEPLVVLPENTTNFEYTAVPVNGATFGPSSQILVDLGNRGFLDPASLFFRYKITYTGVGGETALICGIPAYTPMLRLDTYANSQNIETINNYNSVASLNVNMQMNVADKLGQQFNLGFNDTNVGNETTDGAGIIFGAGITSVSTFYSAPLIGLLGNSEKLIPLFLLNNIRLAITLDTVINVTSNLTANQKISDFSITNFEICYNCIDMGMGVEQEIIRMNPKLRIKSSTWATSLAPSIALGTSGSQSLTFNLRYASVKSCFAIFGGTLNTLSANKLLDSYDITSGNGDYQFNIGGVNYPQRTLSTLQNKAGVMSELRKAMGSVYSNNVSLSVNMNEFSKISANATTVYIPAKFYVAQNLQKMTVPSKGFFTGISTQLAPVQLNINIGTATTQIHNPLLCLNYDSILEIDSMTKSIMMIQ